MTLSGAFTVADTSVYRKIPAAIEQVSSGASAKILLVPGDQLSWDSTLPAHMFSLYKLCADRQIELDISALPDALQQLFQLATAVEANQQETTENKSSFFLRLGTLLKTLKKEVVDAFAFIGEMTFAVGRLFTGRSHMRAVDAVTCLSQSGPQAIGIITLISVLVGMILAYLGIIQLRQFGAQAYVANLVAVGMVREMGALMTAVIMAGRTGAAWAAELGAMKVNEEVDALTTMGIRPVDFLIMPRFLAMLITMPMLCIYSFLLGMLGGGIISLGMDMTPRMYISQLLSSFTPVDVLVGCFKGMVFGQLIVFAGCQSGMNCGNSSAAVGQATTRAVVLSIVLFVVADAGLNIMFYHLGI